LGLDIGLSQRILALAPGVLALASEIGSGFIPDIQLPKKWGFSSRDMFSVLAAEHHRTPLECAPTTKSNGNPIFGRLVDRAPLKGIDLALVQA